MVFNTYASSTMRFTLVCIVVLVGATFLPASHGHGRMMQPPARNAMWRLGFPTKPNYDDNGLFCGGFAVQWQTNKGKCGVCGDAYNGPREHETGGIYASNITVSNYEPGSVVDINIEITANHGGTFTFAMCWRDDFNQKGTTCITQLHDYSTKSDLLSYREWDLLRTGAFGRWIIWVPSEAARRLTKLFDETQTTRGKAV